MKLELQLKLWQPLTTTPMRNAINTPINNPLSKPQTSTSMTNGVQNVGGGSQSWQHTCDTNLFFCTQKTLLRPHKKGVKSLLVFIDRILETSCILRRSAWKHKKTYSKNGWIILNVKTSWSMKLRWTWWKPLHAPHKSWAWCLKQRDYKFQ